MDSIEKNNLTDQYLVDRVLSGDTKAFGIIIQNTEGLVAQITFKMVSNAEDRKDLAQDIYLKAFRNLSSFKFKSKLSTWIGRISYNSCLNYLEKKKLVLLDYTENETQQDALETINTKTITSPNNATDSWIFKKQVSEILKTEIEKLSPIYKTLITLYHNEEFSYEEIVDITGLPEGTVKNYLFRARQALKNNLLLYYKKEEL